jgi:glycosyltransferase involved in cell wall biosynthesis
VVVTDTGGLPEMVEAGRTGLVVPPADSQALARAIVRILDDPAGAREMGNQARDLAVTTYAWSRVAQQTTESYILAAKGQKSGRLLA